MAISYNTGITSTVTNGAAGSHTLTIPAGVLNKDVLLVLVMAFTTATGALTPTLTSSKTAPVQVGSTQGSVGTGAGAGIDVYTSVFSIIAGASDASATLTYGATGGTGGSYWFNVGLAAYTGASNTGVPDCQNGTSSFSNSGTGALTTPSATTVTAGDWQVQLIGVGPPNGYNFAVPGSLTQRQAITSSGNAGLLLEIADSNGSAGGSGTTIGNTSWTTSGGSAGNSWNTAFTVGLAPPSAAGVAYTGSHQPARGKLPQGPYVLGSPGLIYQKSS